MYLTEVKKEFQNMLQRANVFYKIQPCSYNEIRSLETELNLTLPEAYREFLLWMGKESGGFMDIVERVPSNRERAIELMNYNNFPDPLPDDAIVFIEHEGYQFCFIRASEGENPPVHCYCEQCDGSGKLDYNCSDSFVAFLVEKIDAHLRFYKDLGSS
jgi:hypothetical protein